MDDCIFCKIVKGDIPCKKIAENDDFLAFLDISPFSIGHTMVIPKKHYRWTYDVPNFGEYWEFSKKVTLQVKSKLNCLYVTYLTMGNQVPHAHIHIIPRNWDDSLFTNEFCENQRIKVTNDQLDNVLLQIKS